MQNSFRALMNRRYIKWDQGRRVYTITPLGSTIASGETDPLLIGAATRIQEMTDLACERIMRAAR